jgi:hypothetical protein
MKAWKRGLYLIAGLAAVFVAVAATAQAIRQGSWAPIVEAGWLPAVIVAWLGFPPPTSPPPFPAPPPHAGRVSRRGR